MSHEISFANGRNEAAFALTPAWHGLGQVLTEVPDSATMLKAAGLDWEVGTAPLVASLGEKFGKQDVPDKVATFRKDNGRILGVVGDGYGLVQNRESFDFLDSLLQDGIMKYESAGALKGGRLVWILGRLPSVDTVGESDTIQRYVLFSTSHDGSSKLHAGPVATRVVCANTLRIAVGEQFVLGAKHTSGIKGKLDKMKVFLSQFDKQFTLYHESASILIKARWDKTPAGKMAVKQYIDTLFPPVKEEGRARTIRENKVQKVRDNFMARENTLGKMAGTWWQAYNAVTQFVDHEASYKGEGRERDENRMISVLEGDGAKFKTRALELALAAAK